MKRDSSAMLNALTRAQRFIDDSASSLNGVPTSGARRSLDAITNALSAHSVQQTTYTRLALAATAAVRVATNKLTHNHMRPIAAIAAAQLHDVPEFIALSMPRGRMPARRLAAAAGAMRQAATPYREIFVDEGLVPDFLERLDAAVTYLETRLADYGAAKSVRSGATEGIRAATSRGGKQLRVLAALIEPIIAGDDALSAAWASAKRIGGRRTRPSPMAIDPAILATIMAGGARQSASAEEASTAAAV